jgi:DNA-binding transcriptional regulator YiaG
VEQGRTVPDAPALTYLRVIAAALRVAEAALHDPAF